MVLNNDQYMGKSTIKQKVEKVTDIYEYVMSSLNKVLVGQKSAKKIIAASILCDTNSRILLTGGTGVGKTTLAKYLAKSFPSERISVTADMIPSDIQNRLKDKQDMQFLHIDEFNRVSGKTQSALMDLLEENQMNIDGQEYKFSDFYVLATQNSSENSGIFNVPQAVYDRFSVSIDFDYLTDEEKRTLLFSGFVPNLENKISMEDICLVKRILDEFAMDEKDQDLLLSAIDLIDKAQLFGKRLFAGSNIRAHVFALKLAKLKALTSQRDYILPTDYAEIIKYVYRHRIDQNVASIQEASVEDCFNKLQDQIVSLKRRK